MNLNGPLKIPTAFSDPVSDDRTPVVIGHAVIVAMVFATLWDAHRYKRSPIQVRFSL
jgi:hypothetical protein